MRVKTRLAQLEQKIARGRNTSGGIVAYYQLAAPDVAIVPAGSEGKRIAIILPVKADADALG